MKYEIISIGNSNWIVKRDGEEVCKGTFADCKRFIDNDKTYPFRQYNGSYKTQ